MNELLSLSRRRPGRIALAAWGVVLAGSAWAGAADTNASGSQPPVATQAAVWVPKEVQFTYMGFTTHYSCDGLRDNVREMLLQLGARKDDLKVYEQPCAGNPDRPNPFPGVRIKMSVLQPAPAVPSADTRTVPAYWKAVKLPKGVNSLNSAGQCELLEQMRDKILPLFTTRNIDLKSTCVPHQLSAGGASLEAEVLVTDQKKPAKQASAADAQ